MGHELMKRALAEVHRVPEAAFGLLMLLAHDAHDADPHPCCWTSLKVLIEKLEGDASPAAVKRFRRRMTMLEDAGLVTRDCEAHDRPKSRQCPKDHRWFHVELLPPIGDARRPVSAGDRGRPAAEIGDAQRPSYKEYPTEYPKDAAAAGAHIIDGLKRLFERDVNDEDHRKIARAFQGDTDPIWTAELVLSADHRNLIGSPGAYIAHQIKRARNGEIHYRVGGAPAPAGAFPKSGRVNF